MESKVQKIVFSGQIPNGWNLIEQRRLENHTSVILCGKATRYGVEYVTWIYNHDLNGCVLGNYFDRFDLAKRDFAKRS